MLPSIKQRNIPIGWEMAQINRMVLDKKGAIKIGPFGSSLKKEFLTQSGYKVYGQDNVIYKNFSLGERFISDERYKMLSTCAVVPGDFVVSMMGTIGASIIVPEGITPGIMDSHLLRIKVDEKKLLKEFLSHQFQSSLIQRQIKSLSVGGIMAGLSSGIINKLYFLIPAISEQKRIVQVLETWDSSINKLSQKIQARKQIQKGLMRELLIGKRRVEGFSGEWKKLRLGDIGKVSMCKRIFQSQTSTVGDIPFFKIGTFGKLPDAYITNEIYEEYKRKFSFPKKGEILISASGTIGRTVIYDGKPAYFQDSNIVWISNDEKKVLNSFLFYAYKLTEWQTDSSTIARLYNDNLRRVKIHAPDLREQEEISNILITADNEINRLEKKLKLLKDQKKFLLNNLITGAIRTPETLSISK